LQWDRDDIVVDLEHKDVTNNTDPEKNKNKQKEQGQGQPGQQGQQEMEFVSES
tara:strand:- start:212 stop:370 length:159 start_codon:yes stop_codon:yes gene_type:complete